MFDAFSSQPGVPEGAGWFGGGGFGAGCCTALVVVAVVVEAELDGVLLAVLVGDALELLVLVVGDGSAAFVGAHAVKAITLPNNSKAARFFTAVNLHAPARRNHEALIAHR